MTRLIVRDLHVWFGQMHALDSVALTVEPSEIVAILGFNGAGKSTLLRAISRIVPSTGLIELDDQPVPRIPENVVRQGIGHVLQGRGIFTTMSVRDNLLLSRFGSAAVGFTDRMSAIVDSFPMLKPKLNRSGAELSGGEQQMLAIARALITRPKVLLMDEPSLGLSPVMVEHIASAISRVRDEWKTSILLAEQNVQMALDVAERVYVLERGAVVHTGVSRVSVLDDELMRGYLGGSSSVIGADN